MLDVGDLLAKAGIDPALCLVFRHRPQEPDLRRVFQWIAAERDDLFNAYQATQWPRAQSAMTRASHVFSCIGVEAGSALFVGLYRIAGYREITVDEYWAIPENVELREFGMTGWGGDGDDRTSVLLFDLHRDPVFEAYSNRLELDWPGLERSWYRWADRNSFVIRRISDDHLDARGMPDWRGLVLTWAELRGLPRSWAARLAEWRGVYLITDISDGRAYVGSACGADNILGRWRAYAQSGHGGNRDLRGRDARNFRFSILQRVSPDMEADQVIALESGWKTRLLTREVGLNAN